LLRCHGGQCALDTKGGIALLGTRVGPFRAAQIRDRIERRGQIRLAQLIERQARRASLIPDSIRDSIRFH
jgi:hypothetical protein